MKLKNTPGEPIVTRDHGSRFYCIACHGAYTNLGHRGMDLGPLCKCRHYASADTLKREIRYPTARHEAL